MSSQEGVAVAVVLFGLGAAMRQTRLNNVVVYDRVEQSQKSQALLQSPKTVTV